MCNDEKKEMFYDGLHLTCTLDDHLLQFSFSLKLLILVKNLFFLCH